MLVVCIVYSENNGNIAGSACVGSRKARQGAKYSGTTMPLLEHSRLGFAQQVTTSKRKAIV
jgi:hypothetical protein